MHPVTGGGPGWALAGGDLGVSRLKPSGRRFKIASASGAAITTASMCLQNSGSLNALRISARNGRILKGCRNLAVRPSEGVRIDRARGHQ